MHHPIFAIIAAVLPITAALTCDAGTYFDGLKCSSCPGGTFGFSPGLSSPTCSGVCAAEFFCPEGSTSPRQKPCGASIFYCPPGSAERHRVDEGFYTVTFHHENDTPDTLRNAAREQIRCETGYYCVFGIRRACPAGTYGDSTRLLSPACSARCPLGSYCPLASTKPQPCPAGTFGDHLSLATSECSGPCPIGHYCESGTIVPKPCPAGTFGGSLGLTTKACSSTCSQAQECLPSSCPEGFYCPLATTKPVECGAVGIFCPEGSAQPTTATAGYYTTWRAYAGMSMTGEPLEMQYVDGYALATLNQTTRSDQQVCEKGSYCAGGVKQLCPAGVYGDSAGLTSAACTAPCPPGYFCPIGTADYHQHPCVSRISFCKEGSALPASVDVGYLAVLSSINLRVDQVICPAGSFCLDGVQYLCPAGTYGATTGLASTACSGKCLDGYVCSRGSTSATQSPCPAGSYSRNGVLCAPCWPGYWCAEASPDPQQNACSSDTMLCPLGSAAAP